MSSQQIYKVEGLVKRHARGKLMFATIVAVLTGSLLRCTGGNEDRVTFTESVTDESGVLVDGKRGDTEVRDQVFREQPGKDILIGNFTAGSRTVIAYTVGHAPTMVAPDDSATWTLDPDIAPVSFEDEYPLKVVFWVVAEPFGVGADKARDFIKYTNAIWKKERQGLRLIDDKEDPTVIRDATPKKNANGIGVTQFQKHKVSCGEGIESNSDGIGSEDGAMNVYYVSLVQTDDNQKNSSFVARNFGERCTNGNVILMGEDTDPDLLAHELGHSFTLDHIDDMKGFFDQRNVMHSVKRTAGTYLTEGQTLRGIINSGSSVNLLFHKRDNQIMIRENPFCLGNTLPLPGDNHCPPLQMRIWADKGKKGKIWGPDPCASGCNPPVMVKIANKPQAGHPALPPEVREALEYYLDVRCLVPSAGEPKRKPLAELLAIARRLKVEAVLEERLLSLLTQGPDRELLKQMQEDLEEEWSDFQDLRKIDPTLSPSTGRLKITQPLTQDAYISERLAQIKQRYRERSAIALVRMNSQRGKIIVKREAAKDEALRRVVEAAIE